MRVRRDAIAAVVVAAVAMLGPRAALAQGGAQRGPAPTPLPAGEAAAIQQLMKPATVLGEAWASALRAVLDGIKHVVDDGERLEAQQALGAKALPPHASPSPPMVPSLRAAWLPGGALRDAVARSPIWVTPVAVAPPTESPVDTRGEHAILLGVRMQLPWLLP